MNAINSYIFSGWSAIRVIRLVAGLVLLGEGIRIGDLAMALAGGIFAVLPLFNVGLCSTSSCAVPQKRNDNIEDVTFEEIKDNGE